MTEIVERSDIQGLIASGYNHLNSARFAFLQILDSRKAQDWLTRITEKITTAEYPEDRLSTCFNLALSWQGIKQLGIPDSLIQNFPHEFVAGMNRPEAAGILGDTGESSEHRWEYGGSTTSTTKPLHVLALLYGPSAEAVELLYQATCGQDALNGGLKVTVKQDSTRDDFEPFRFRDGISQPPVSGLTGRSKKPVEQEIKTGEFVLGYENEFGLIARIPSVDISEDQDGCLGRHPIEPDKLRALGLNGTYMVFRKLSQNVDGFWRYVKDQAKDSNMQPELIAAKMVGRWPAGAPLVLSPDAPAPAEAEINDFLYTTTDPDGLRCPMGTHIRRANPRDSLPMGRSKSLRVSRRHRIIRRGRKYSEAAEGWTSGNAGNQGLYFIALNANLRRQFEFIQQTWLNSATFNGLDNEKDPIVGDNAGQHEFTIQGGSLSRRLKALPRFVTVRGGGYFFLPGIQALRFLSSYVGKAEIKRPPSYSLPDHVRQPAE